MLGDGPQCPGWLAVVPTTVRAAGVGAAVPVAVVSAVAISVGRSRMSVGVAVGGALLRELLIHGLLGHAEYMADALWSRSGSWIKPESSSTSRLTLAPWEP